MPHPSFSPVILRIELPSYNSIQETLNYSAPRSAEPLLDSKHFSSLDAAVHRGRRHFQSLQIITYEMQATSENADSSSQITEHNELVFYCGNPIVEIAEGIIHLFKTKQPLSEACTTSMLCMMNVPAFLTVKDIVNFIFESKDSIEQIKIVKNDLPNLYMVLMKFIDATAALQFYERYNNTTFNSVEREVCQLVLVERVEALTSASGACFPLQGYDELPTCPVCIERLDEPLRDLFTILCTHTFHGSCIAKTDESICPVCRYMQTPECMGEHSCAKCALQENLWMCIVCGHVGCGRYGQKHAHEHFMETGHIFALEIGKNQVWDYAEDSYVHRLVASEETGKPVQVGGSVDQHVDKKASFLHLEHTAILTSCLESQRVYFEERLTEMQKKCADQMSLLQVKLSDTRDQLNTLNDKCDNLAKEKTMCEKKITSLTTSLQKAEKSLSEERVLNQSLLANQEEWRNKYTNEVRQLKVDIKKKDDLIQDLQEQVNDLMVNLEFRSKLATNSQVTQEELEASQIMVGDAPPSTSSGSGGRLSSAALRKLRQKKS